VTSINDDWLLLASHILAHQTTAITVAINSKASALFKKSIIQKQLVYNRHLIIVFIAATLSQRQLILVNHRSCKK
jgi:hypothetical protein